MKNIKPNKKVIVSISGGVDSSVAAVLLKSAGYDLIGVFMKFWSDPNIKDEESTNKCCTLDAYKDVKKLSNILDFPIYTIDYSEKFKKLIVDDFIDGYRRGITPNPCVRCNKFIKFRELFRVAEKFGAYYIATGHYAIIKREKGIYSIYRSSDLHKDQTYYMYNLRQDDLKRILFPVGKYKKEKVRELAKEFNLPMYAKKDSTEICFVPSPSKGGYRAFLKRFIDIMPGDIMTLDGEVVGRHTGLVNYTRGQRKGLNISNGQGPYFVIKADYKKNILYVSNKIDDLFLYSDLVYVSDLNWISGSIPKLPYKCLCSIRYGHSAEAMLQSFNEGSLIVKFKSPQRAIMPGQSAVFYKGDKLLGGGIIIDVDNILRN